MQTVCPDQPVDLAWTRARLVPSDGPARTGKGEQTCQWKEVGWVTWGCQRLNWYHTHRRSHTCRRQAPVFSADGWGRPGQLAHPGPLLSLYALVFCWNLQLKTEVLFTYYLLTTIKKNNNKKLKVNLWVKIASYMMEEASTRWAWWRSWE